VGTVSKELEEFWGGLVGFQHRGYGGGRGGNPSVGGRGRWTPFEEQDRQQREQLCGGKAMPRNGGSEIEKRGRGRCRTGSTSHSTRIQGRGKRFYCRIRTLG